MLYGRRRIDRKIDPSLVRDTRKKRWILDRNFQVNYTTYLTLAVSGSTLIAFGAVFYFIDQNFDIFVALAFDTNPGLVQHLEREVSWLKFFLVSSFSIIAFSTFLLTLRMTRRLVDPLIQLEHHMRKLMQGRWDIPDLENPDRDFSELLATYDYFYRSLRAITESELELLKKLSVDPANREAYAAWKTLLETKSQRLGVPLSSERSELRLVTSENDARPVAKPKPRRAS